jgi:hypothetical protein
VWLKDAPHDFRSVAAKINPHPGFYRARTGYDTKLPFGEIEWNGRAVDWNRVWDNLWNDQRNAGAELTGENTRLPQGGQG